MKTWACAESNAMRSSFGAVSATTGAMAGSGAQAAGLGRRDSSVVASASASARVTAPTMLSLARHGRISCS
ncbi:hypothetical protein D3C84_897850 [compost metagenome]